jgi:transposase
MILPGGPLRIFVATRPVDFRKGINGLAAVVQQQLRLDPFCGAVFVFRAKRTDRVKLLVWDGGGLTLIYKRLDEARFVWSRIADGVMRLSPGSAPCSRGSTGSGCTAVAWPGRNSRSDPATK